MNTCWARVTGDSMQPLLESGDMVRVAPCCPENLVPGELVLYQSELPCVHRLIEKRGRMGRLVFRSRGDARWNPDQPWGQEQIVGRIERVRFQRGGGERSLLEPRFRVLGRAIALLARLELMMGHRLGFLSASNAPLPGRWGWLRFPIRFLTRAQAVLLRGS